MVEVIAIHIVGPEHHSHIGEMKWNNPVTKTHGATSRAAMVDFVRANPNTAYVQGPTRQAFLKVVDTTPPYVQTYADGTWTDNLLNLPRY